jgi:predicted membrane protein (TIGR00267 family)
MTPLSQEIERLKGYEELAGISEIARRYFAMNSFDGILTILGVMVGNYLADVRTASVVILTGVSTSVSMGVSGLWGAYLTESAERQKSLNEIEEYTLTDLTDTRIGRAGRFAVVVVAIVDGFAPLLSSLLVLLPFMLTPVWGDITYSYGIALTVAMMALFGLGAFLGRISRQSMVVAGAKMITAGAASLLLSYLIERLIRP